MAIDNLAARMVAEKDCKTWDEVDACRRAYSDLYWDKVDVIQQQHGLRPLLRYSEQLFEKAGRT